MNAGIGVNQHAFGGETLRAVASYCIAVVKVATRVRVELDLAVVVEGGRDLPIGLNRFDGGEVAIGYAKRSVGCGELDAIAYGEFAFDLLVDADSREAPGIVGRKLLVRFLDCEQVFGCVDRDHECIGRGFYSNRFATPRVANYVVDLVVACPSMKLLIEGNAR